MCCNFCEKVNYDGVQVCGARGGGDGAAQGLFLALSSQHVFMLALETPAKRNVCILLLRKVRACIVPLRNVRASMAWTASVRIPYNVLSSPPDGWMQVCR